jgi:hypothetical protein
MSAYEFTISLRIRHPQIDPNKITEALSLQPQHSWKAGASRQTSTGGGGEHRDSYWMARLMDEPLLTTPEISFESVLVRTITQLRRAQAFLEQLHAEGAISELSISLFARKNFRLELSPDTMTLMGRMGLAVAFEVQPHAHPEASTRNN